LCGKDPVPATIYFEKRWRSFFNQVIKNPNGPLGKVEHFFWRIEYQVIKN